MVEEAPLYIVLAFPDSNPLHKVDGREPGEASRHLWGCEGSCWGSEWAEGTERPPVMGWHEIQQARVHSPLKLRQVVLLEG